MSYRALLLLCLTWFAPVTEALQPPNLDLLKARLVRYHDTGAYAHDLAEAMAPAKTYLLRRITENQRATKPEKLAIVLDIDETALSNYTNIVTHHFAVDDQAFADGVHQKTSTAIHPTLELFNIAIQHHVAVFFVTGRWDALRTDTIANLEHEGYHHWRSMFMKPVDYNKTHPSVASFKTAQRRAISEQGYTITLNIGDQRSDLDGAYAEKTVLLPNPFYYVH